LDTKAKSGVLHAANILMIAMLLSRLLGYVRDIIILATFGQNSYTDAYNAAFSVPDTLYMLLVGGALSAAFIPIFSSYIARNQEQQGWKSVSIIFNWIMLLMVIGVTLGIIFAPAFVDILVPGFDAQTKQLTICLTRIMFIQVIFMCFSGISTGLLQSYKNFTAPALGSVLYNVGIIIGGLLLMKPIEHFFPGYGIAGFSIGVVLGAFLNFFVQFRALLKIGINYQFSFDTKDEGFRELIILIIPVLIGLGAQQLNLFVNQNLASGLSPGLLTALRNAQRIMQVPISIFGIAVGVAVFPTMTGLAATEKIKEFKETLIMGIRTVIFVTIPASVGIAVLSTPIIRLLYEYSGGNFTAENTAQTAYALTFYCIGIFAYSAVHTLSRSFYALKDTRTPVWCAVISIVGNIIFSLLLVNVMQQGGLALAYSIAGILNMAVLLFLLHRKIGAFGGKALVTSVIKTIAIAAVMGVIVYAVSFIFENFLFVEYKVMQIIEILISIAIGVLVYAFISLKLKMPEAEQAMGIFKRKFGRRSKRKSESKSQTDQNMIDDEEKITDIKDDDKL
jgi:putative peptidoglycan lipid II flippase